MVGQFAGDDMGQQAGAGQPLLDRLGEPGCDDDVAKFLDARDAISSESDAAIEANLKP